MFQYWNDKSKSPSPIGLPPSKRGRKSEKQPLLIYCLVPLFKGGAAIAAGGFALKHLSIKREFKTILNKSLAGLYDKIRHHFLYNPIFKARRWSHLCTSFC